MQANAAAGVGPAQTRPPGSAQQPQATALANTCDCETEAAAPPPHTARMRHALAAAARPILASTTTAAATAAAATMEATLTAAGALPDGRRVDRVTLTAPLGLRAELLTYGATLVSVKAPGGASAAAAEVRRRPRPLTCAPSLLPVAG